MHLAPCVTTIAKETVGGQTDYMSKRILVERPCRDHVSSPNGWAHNVSAYGMLTLAKQAVNFLNRSLEQLCRSDAWLEQNVSRSIGQRGLRFVEVHWPGSLMASQWH